MVIYCFSWIFIRIILGWSPVPYEAKIMLLPGSPLEENSSLSSQVEPHLSNVESPGLKLDFSTLLKVAQASASERPLALSLPPFFT